MTWLQRVEHIPGQRAGMAGSEHHQCHQQRGWGTEILSNLASWLGGGTCSPVSSEHPALPPRACRGGAQPVCHRRCGACATAPGLDGRSSLRTEARRHGGCGPARGAGWSAGGRRSPPAPRPVKRGCARSSPSFPAAPRGVSPPSQVTFDVACCPSDPVSEGPGAWRLFPAGRLFRTRGGWREEPRQGRSAGSACPRGRRGRVPHPRAAGKERGRGRRGEFTVADRLCCVSSDAPGRL